MELKITLGYFREADIENGHVPFRLSLSILGTFIILKKTRKWGRKADKLHSCCISLCIPLNISIAISKVGILIKPLFLLPLRFSESSILCVMFGTKHFFWFSYFVILARRNVIYFIAFRIYIAFNFWVTAR